MNNEHLHSQDFSINNDAQMAAEVAKEFIKRTGSTVEIEEELVRRVKEARAALEESTNTFKKDWFDWIDQSKTLLGEYRQWRMAMGSEATLALKQFGDVRKFFLSDEHTAEVARLKEFVELCERLKVLKESGFLDKVADTMLKLEEGK